MTSLKGKEYKATSRWLRANHVDAQQLAAEFHLGDPNYDEITDRIWDAIRGWPKAEVVEMARWLDKNRHEAEAFGEPFSAVIALEGHARKKKWRKQAKAQGARTAQEAG